METLLGLICGLLPLALLGALIYAIVRYSRAPSATYQRSGPGAFSLCRRCGSPIVGLNCQVCNFPGSPKPHSTERALESIRQRIQLMADAGLLPPDAGERLLKSVAAEVEHAAAAGLTPSAADVVEATVVDETPTSQSIPPRPAAFEPIPVTPAISRPTPAPAAPYASPSAEVRARAERFQQAQQQAAAKSIAEPSAIAPPAPRRSWTEWLAGFMEEKNVRWGELIGGLLIVGGSVALVISFWSQIASQPLLKFGLFNGIVAALFAVGFYTQKKWGLPTTSRGVLVIATLLVPLNFLSLAAVSRGTADGAGLALLGEAVSIVLFSGLVFVAGRTIASPAPVALTVGVLGASAAQLAIRRWAHAEMSLAGEYALCGLPLACFAAAIGAIVVRLRRAAELTEPMIHALLRIVGLTAFAAIAPCGMLLNLSGDAGGALSRLAPLAALAGVPPLAAGLLLWRRLRDSELTGLRTAGTAIAALGSLIMLGSLGLAWPEPALLAAVALIVFVALTWVAVAYELPAAHLLAAVALSVGSLIALHVFRGELTWTGGATATTIGALLSAVSGNALVAIAALYALASLGWRKLGRVRDMLYYLLAAAAAAVASIVLVTLYGLGVAGDPFGSTWVYALYAVAALGASVATLPLASRLPERARRLPAALAWAGSALLALALVQGVVYWPAPTGRLAAPWTMAAVFHGLIAAGLAIGIRWRSEARDAVQRALEHSAMATSITAAALVALDALGWGIPRVDPLACAAPATLVALIWFALAGLRNSPALFAAGQGALFASATLLGFDFASRQSWWESGRPLTADPRLLQIVGCGWALLCLAWLALRIVVERLGISASEVPTSADDPTTAADGAGRAHWSLRLSALLRPNWPAVDYLATGVVAGCVVLMASYAAWPGMAQELSPRSSVMQLASRSPELVIHVPPTRTVPAPAAFELFDIPHAPAAAAGSWLLLALAAVLLIAGLWERANGWRVLGMLIVLAGVVPLWAAHWEPDVAVASALRWLSAGYFLAGSIGIWSRERLCRWGENLGWRLPASSQRRLARTSIAALALLAAAPLAAMAIHVSLAALQHATIAAAAGDLLVVMAILCAASFGVALALALSGRWSSSANGSRDWGAWANSAGALVLALGAAPLVTVSAYIVAAALAGDPVVGPNPGSLFHAMGLALNYSLPAALVALTLTGYALVERSASFAFVAGLVTNLTATVGYLFAAGSRLSADDPLLWTQLGLLNALVAALFGIAWYAVTWAWSRRQGAVQFLERLQIAQAGQSLALLLLVLSAAATALVRKPWLNPSWITETAGALGIAALAATLGLALLLSAGRSRVATTALAAGGLWCAATVLGTGALRWDTGNWLAYHVLMATRIAAPWLMIAGAWWWRRREVLALDDRPRRAATLWTSLLAAPTVFLSLRLVGSAAPQEPWWSTAGLTIASALMASLAIWSCRRLFLYVASALGVVAMAVWYPRSVFWPTAGSEQFFGFFYANLIALALPAIAWLWIELRWIRPQRDLLSPGWGMPVHLPATWFGLAVLGMLTAEGVYSDFAGLHEATTTIISGLAILATGLAVVSCLWDVRARGAAAALYLYGLVLVGAFIDALDLSGDRLLFNGAIALGAFTLAASYLWSRRRGLQRVAGLLAMPPRPEANIGGALWIRSLTTILVSAVVALVYWVVLVCPDQALRISAGQAAIIQAFALGMLAEGTRRPALQRDALLVGLLGMVAFSWALIEPGAAAPVLQRSVAACVALVAVGIFCALGIARLPLKTSDWVEAARRFAPGTIVALIVAVLAVMGQEAFHFINHGDVPIAWPGRLAVALSLLTLFAASLTAALLPGRDPLGLSERGRMVYVYAAEAVLALLFLHVRVTMPWLFSGVFLAYWPLIVMAIAYLGVGLAEWFGRRQQKILAEPMERTGVLLPLLPVIGFWFVQETRTDYSLLLLVVGGLYAALAVTRKSLGFGLLAALAANGGLWHYLHRAGGVAFLEHPQLWLIPPALCVLGAAYLNRDRLTTAQMTAVRYIASMTIYLSSTADIFLQGVAQAPWLPLVLAALAVAGVFVGILLRVRAFLFLGTGFLTLAIVAMIWHAAVDLDQTWIWWASLIAMGVAIIVLFAVFEKRRQDVLRMVEQLKQWEG